METNKPIKPFRSRAALLATAYLIAPLSAGEPRLGQGLAGSEVSRRGAAIEEARELLRKGDESYTAGRYDEAVVAYSGARGLIPDAPVSAELRAAATERFAQASVEHARVLGRKGNIAAANAAIDKVLLPTVDPQNLAALAFRDELNDPIRTNPALTPEHAKNIDAVRIALYTAEGAFNLGKYAEATSHYEDALRIDPTNAAARRGMEQVASARSHYEKSASDHTRAELLSQVDALWELQPPASDIEPSLTGTGTVGGGQDYIPLSNKIDRIIIPKLALDQSSLEEALDFLRLRSQENDIFELDPSRKGVNFTLNLGAPDSPEALRVRNARFDLQLSNVPLSRVLSYITAATNTSFTTDEFSVIIRPTESFSVEMVTRTYRVPPDFISSMGSSAPAQAAADPFGTAPAGGLLARRLGAQEALAAQGVAFPEGASASYSPTTNTLRVVNTPLNQDYVTQLIDTITSTEPVMIAVRVTMIRVQQTRLEELGFDWLLDNYGFGGDSWVPGASKLNLGGGTVGTGSDLGDIPLPSGSTTRNPITGGNRSGDSAISGNSIDGLLGNAGGRQGDNRAPGVFGLRGEIDGATVQTLMRGLNQKKGVDLMAQPSTVTRSGQSSSIAIVREFIYPTEYEPPELPNSTGSQFGGGGGITPVTPATPTAFATRDVGINLEVLPVADENKRFVNITLNPSFTDFDGFVNYGSPINSTVEGLLGPETATVTENAILMPVFSKQALSTNVDVADGGTIVLGGLLSERVENVEDQTPILGSLPIVGRFFQSKVRQNISTAIIFLVNVELMDPTGRRYREP